MARLRNRREAAIPTPPVIAVTANAEDGVENLGEVCKGRGSSLKGEMFQDAHDETVLDKFDQLLKAVFLCK